MNFNKALELIEAAQRILLTTHVRPDGDAIGSLTALQMIIEHYAHQKEKSCSTQLLFLSDVPENYQFMLKQKPWLLDEQITRKEIENGSLDQFDLIIVVDTSAQLQLPGLVPYLMQREKGVLVIDHHLSGDQIGQCRLIDTKAAASGEIIFDLFGQAKWHLDEPIAQALFAAIATDTGWFRFENCTARTYAIAAELTAAGARPNELYRKLFQSYPPERLHLLALVLGNLELHCDGRLALMQITREMLQTSGAKRRHIENIVNEPQQIHSVEISVLLVEQEDGQTRCSFRSRTDIDVNIIARQFGGGGHARAAGATLDMPIAQGHKKIIKIFRDALAINLTEKGHCRCELW